MASEENSDILVASYTISAPAAPVSPAVTSQKNEIKDDKDDGLATTNSTTTTSYTISKPVTTNSDKDNKRDSSITATFNVSSAVIGNNLSSNKKTDEDDDPDLDNNRISSNGEEIIRTKSSKEQLQPRSLFELDNASSLTLADKLRHEANKYSDDNEVGDSVKIGNSNNKGVITTASSIETPPASPSLVNSSATERRPSWRLKVDAGSKV